MECVKKKEKAQLQPDFFDRLRHSTVVVLCLFTLSKEQEVEKCMC